MRKILTGCLVFLGFSTGLGWLGAQDSNPTIKEIMDRLHKGTNPPLVQVKRELQARQPNWEEIQRTTRDFDSLGEALTKTKPPRGASESWSQLAGQYYEDAHAMNAAADRKDQQGALAARARLAGSCMGCHKAHKAS